MYDNPLLARRETLVMPQRFLVDCFPLIIDAVPARCDPLSGASIPSQTELQEHGANTAGILPYSLSRTQIVFTYSVPFVPLHFLPSLRIV